VAEFDPIDHRSDLQEVVMKRALVGFLVLLWIVILSPEAECIGLYGTYWDGKDLGDGYGLGAKWKIQIIPILGLDLRGGWVSFSDSDASIIPLEATGFASFGVVYGGVGIGYYIFNADIGNPDNSAGSYLLLGAKIAPGGTGLFGELKYTFVGTDVQDLEIPTKIKADGFGLNLGVLFNW
jgi:hypothetical protein